MDFKEHVSVVRAYMSLAKTQDLQKHVREVWASTNAEGNVIHT